MPDLPQVWKTPHIRSVHKVCWHLDLNATPVPSPGPELVDYNPEVEGLTPEPYFEKYVVRKDNACIRCRLKIEPLMKVLEAASKWVTQLKPSTGGQAVFNPFSEAQKRLEEIFTQASQEDVKDNQNPWHKLPLARYTRQLRQLTVFAEEVKLEITCHDKPKLKIVEAAFLVLGDKFLGNHVWEHVSDAKLRDVFGEALKDIMCVVLDMWEITELENDIEARMKTGFATKGL